MNLWLTLAGLFIAIVGGAILVGIRGFVSSTRELSVKRQRLLGIGFVLLGASLLIQGLTSASTALLVVSALLAFLAVAAFIWSIVVARQDAKSI